MSFTLHLPRRRHCPPAPPLPVRMGPVCHCSAINHAVGWDSQLAVEAEKLLARLRNRADLVAALDMRLLDCPTAGPAEVTR